MKREHREGDLLRAIGGAVLIIFHIVMLSLIFSGAIKLLYLVIKS